ALGTHRLLRLLGALSIITPSTRASSTHRHRRMANPLSCVELRWPQCSPSDKMTTMSTASARPQLQIRQAQEGDASALCEIFNEAVQDHLETFDSESRTVEDQRLSLEAAEHDPKHPILVAELRNWIAGWVTLAPYDGRIALDDIGEVYIYVRRAFRSYGVG